MKLKNSGAIPELSIYSNTSGDRIEPIILVGRNGAGKTNALSYVADALIEIADEMFQDVRPTSVGGKPYFRVLGGITRRSNAAYELSVLKFSSSSGDILYVAKAGDLAGEPLPPEATIVSAELSEVNKKIVKYEGTKPEAEFLTGVHIFFSASRSENAYWQNESYPAAEVIGHRAFANRLGKGILPERNRQDIKSWVAKVVLAITMDVQEVIRRLADIRQFIQDATLSRSRWSECNSVLSAIVQQPARFVKTDRHNGADVLQISLDGDRRQIAFEALSAGQNHLLNCFLEILRQGDTIRDQKIEDITGIVVIDEADAHLHIQLQVDVLPQLMLMFPKIQFILSLHSPFAVLGIDRAYSGGYQLVDMPSG